MAYGDRIWATMRVNTGAMTDDQRKHYRKAVDELSLAGITFDTGGECGSGLHDWELDWSLKGAELWNPREPKERVPNLEPVASKSCGL